MSLKFLDVGERDALRAYLISRLERTKKTVQQALIESSTFAHNLCVGCHTADDLGNLVSRILSQQMQWIGRHRCIGIRLSWCRKSSNGESYHRRRSPPLFWNIQGLPPCPVYVVVPKLTWYQTNLDKDTVYDLIQGHGRTDMYLFYAKIVGDCDRVIEHWVMEEQWLKAIEILSGQVSAAMWM